MARRVLSTVPAEEYSSAVLSTADVTPECAEVQAEETTYECLVINGSLGVEKVHCSGWWEILPSICSCGSLSMCAFCAGDSLGAILIEPEYGKDAGEVQEDITGAAAMGMLQSELRVLGGNLDRMGSLQHDMGSIVGEIQSMLPEMVSRAAFENIANRLLRLGEDLVEEHSAYDSDNDHTGYTDYDSSENDNG